MEKLLTIVVPVYKVEQYINKCLDSCIIYKADGTLDEDKMNQLEVIIVNDGTPDRSAELSREYTARYPQTFRQIDKENGGHGSAWNVGLKEATGKYLRFLDSDDWFETANLVLLMERLATENADLVFTPMHPFVVEENKAYDQYMKGMDFDTMYHTDEFDWIGAKNELIFHMTTYRTNMLQKHIPLFLEKQFYDDTILQVLPIIESKTFTYYNLPLYYYLMGRVGQTISVEANIKHVDDRIRVEKQIIEFCEAHPNMNGTIGTFVRWKLKRVYEGRYKDLCSMPYQLGKAKTAEWDKWVRQHAPEHNGRWIKLYRKLPYCMFRMVHNMAACIVKYKKYLKK